MSKYHIVTITTGIGVIIALGISLYINFKQYSMLSQMNQTLNNMQHNTNVRLSSLRRHVINHQTG